MAGRRTAPTRIPRDCARHRQLQYAKSAEKIAQARALVAVFLSRLAWRTQGEAGLGRSPVLELHSRCFRISTVSDSTTAKHPSGKSQPDRIQQECRTWSFTQTRVRDRRVAKAVLGHGEYPRVAAVVLSPIPNESRAVVCAP